MSNKRYWFCLIGPAEEENLPMGSDYPMRAVVKEQFSDLTGNDANHCWSGWESNEEIVNVLLTIFNLNPDDPDFIKIKEIINAKN